MPDLNRKSKILILGTGLIGSAFIRLFNTKNFTEVLNVNRKTVDLTNLAETKELFDDFKPEFVINAAGKVGGIVANRDQPADFMLTNLSIQLNVMKAAHAVGVERLIFFASSCMYPKAAAQPMKEDALLTGKPEETSLAYAISKLAGLQLCLAFNQQYGVTKYIPVIPNSVYGPNDNFDPATGHVLSSLIRRFHEAKSNGVDEVILWGSGTPQREFIHTDDLAQACFLLLLNNLDHISLPVNIGVGEDISIKDLAQLVADIVGYVGRIKWDITKPDGAPKKLLDSSQINRVGWTPEITLADGIKATYDWYWRRLALQS